MVLHPQRPGPGRPLGLRQLRCRQRGGRLGDQPVLHGNLHRRRRRRGDVPVRDGDELGRSDDHRRQRDRYQLRRRAGGGGGTRQRYLLRNAHDDSHRPATPDHGAPSPSARGNRAGRFRQRSRDVSCDLVPHQHDREPRLPRVPPHAKRADRALRRCAALPAASGTTAASHAVRAPSPRRHGSAHDLAPGHAPGMDRNPADEAGPRKTGGHPHPPPVASTTATTEVDDSHQQQQQ